MTSWVMRKELIDPSKPRRADLWKPFGRKAYGHIPHLPGSRMGTGDHHCSPGQAAICCEKARDKHDRVIVQEKIDGSCVSVGMVTGLLVFMGRSGFLCSDSPFVTHHDFQRWAEHNRTRFVSLLAEGERVIGEWIGHAVGTMYDLQHPPFVAFDIMRENKRVCADETRWRCERAGLVTPRVISDGPPCSIARALECIRWSGHGAIETVEGAVWRVEKSGKVDFLAKFVRHEKADGKYLPRAEDGAPSEPTLNLNIDRWMP